MPPRQVKKTVTTTTTSKLISPPPISSPNRIVTTHRTAPQHFTIVNSPSNNAAHTILPALAVGALAGAATSAAIS